MNPVSDSTIGVGGLSGPLSLAKDFSLSLRLYAFERD